MLYPGNVTWTVACSSYDSFAWSVYLTAYSVKKPFLIVFDAPKLLFCLKSSVTPEPEDQFDIPLCNRVNFSTLNTDYLSNLLKIVIFNF